MKNEIRLPDGFLDKYLLRGRDTYLFGQPVKDFNTDQLLAAIGCAMVKLESDAERAQHDRDYLMDLTRRA